ncbi:MAG: GNAT family N-acetyltransferase [Chloroflexota bacterium]|nr:GNAT family N-acetyltransferase [Chloroflexota bacterium]
MTDPGIRLLGQNDYQALERFLASHLASSMFLIGNARSSGLKDDGSRFSGTYAGVFKDDTLTGVIAHYWNGNIIPQAPSHLEPLLETLLRASGRPVYGVLGPAGQVDMIVETLSIDPTLAKLHETESLYHLSLSDLVLPQGLKQPEVVARRIEPGDEELMTRWRIAYSLENLGDSDTPELREACRQSIQHYILSRQLWVLQVDGEPVSCSAFNASINEAVQIGGVFTPPPLRCRGYARAVVAASLLEARQQGVPQAILFTGNENRAARRAYEALGFRQTGWFKLFLLTEPIWPALP